MYGKLLASLSSAMLKNISFACSNKLSTDCVNKYIHKQNLQISDMNQIVFIVNLPWEELVAFVSQSC